MNSPAPINYDPYHRVLLTPLPMLNPSALVLRASFDPMFIPTPRSLGKAAKTNVANFHERQRSVLSLRLDSPKELNMSLTLMFCLQIDHNVTTKEVVFEDSGEIIRKKVPIREYVPEDVPSNYKEFVYTERARRKVELHADSSNSTLPLSHQLVAVSDYHEAARLSYVHDTPIMLAFGYQMLMLSSEPSLNTDMLSFKERAWGYHEIGLDSLDFAVDTGLVGFQPTLYHTYTPLTEKQVRELSHIIATLREPSTHLLDININRIRKFESTVISKRTWNAAEIDNDVKFTMSSSGHSFSFLIPKWLIRDTFEIPVDVVDEEFGQIRTMSVDNDKIDCSYYIATMDSGKDRSPLQQHINVQRKMIAGFPFAPNTKVEYPYRAIQGKAIIFPKPTLKDITNFTNITEDNWENSSTNLSPFTKEATKSTPIWLAMIVDGGAGILEIMNSPLCPEDQTPILREALDYDTPEEQILFLKRHFKLLG